MSEQNEYMTFKNRETYIQQRANWRKDYADLSAHIRQLKNHISNSMRSKSPLDRANAAMEQVADLPQARHTARVMMDIRAKQKVRAAEQSQKEYAARVVAVA